MKRTQQQRKQETVSRLLDATLECLIELGYSRTSIQQICLKAGISHGGLFRHFDTRMDLIIALAERTSEDLVALFRERFQALKASDDPVHLALLLLRRNCRDVVSEAWFELFMAARTDPQLKDAMALLWQTNFQQILELAAREFPELSRHKDFSSLVSTVVFMFHGEALNSYVMADPVQDEGRLGLMTSLVQGFRQLPRDQ